MLTEKYKPKSLREIVGQKDIIRAISIWMRNWRQGHALLIHGPTGTGKTIIITTLARDNKLDLIEVNASHDYTSLEEVLTSVKQAPLFSKGKIILIDEADNTGSPGLIMKIIEQSKFPVILTANNAYSPRLRTLRSLCRIVKINKIPDLDIEKKLREISKKENIEVEDSLLKKIVRNSDGDIRSAITDLETISHGPSAHERKKEIDIFNVLKTIFRAKDLRTALNAIEKSDKDINEIFWWIEQNICNEYSDPKDIAVAFDLLSKADMFKYRWRMHELLAGISLIREKPYSKFVSYRSPEKFMILGLTRAERYATNHFCDELAKYLHCSRRSIKNQLPYLNQILKLK